MALPAVFRLPGLGAGEHVAGVAGGASPVASSGLIRPIPVLGQVAGSSLPFAITLTMLPWHFWQPVMAAGLPSTTTPRKLSREPMNCVALAWWLAWNSVTCRWWHLAQSLGDTMVATRLPSCSQASGSPLFAA